MTPLATARFARPNERGTVLALTVHVVLLLLVLGQVVYLASRQRVRVDLTTDKLYSLTESTRNLLGKLEKRLVIEAYFSPKEKLPVNLRETRAVLDNFLDEVVQLGKGKVVVQRFDPNADKAVTDRCTRTGVQPLDLRSTSSTSMSVDRHWQGLRLVYGGGKQKVLPQFAPPSSFVAEALFTPAVKEVVTEQRRKFGYMEWPATATGQQTPGGIGWNMLRTIDQIAKRYEFQNYKDEDAALLPLDLDTLFLFRPKDLSDRQKYVLDQFLMHGGTLVVFADAAEYSIGPNRQFTQVPFLFDAAGSARKLQDQLWHYGIDWKPKLLADMAGEAHTARMGQAVEYLAIQQQTSFGPQATAVPYPYFFHAMAGDWSRVSDQLAKDEKGKVDPGAAEQYRKMFGSGMPTDDFLFKSFHQIGRGPGFYWPTWVGLRERAGGVPDLPAGVTGRVLLKSSPAMLAEDPPQMVDPLGQGDARARQAHLQRFQQKLVERFRSEPRHQAPLMVDVRGTFGSFFASGDRPRRPSEIKEEETRKAEQAAKDEAAKDGEQKPVEQKPDVVKPGEPNPGDVGPPTQKAAETETPKAPLEAPTLLKGEKSGRIVMVGDADFVRDDFVRGDYKQVGGPWSSLGPLFFAQMLDWLAEDRDLIELQSRVPVDRTMKFLDAEAVPNSDARLAEQSLRSKTSWLRAINVVVPCGLLAVFGLSVFLVRRSQKRSFLASLSS